MDRHLLGKTRKTEYECFLTHIFIIIGLRFRFYVVKPIFFSYVLLIIVEIVKRKTGLNKFLRSNGRRKTIG